MEGVAASWNESRAAVLRDSQQPSGSVGVAATQNNTNTR